MSPHEPVRIALEISRTPSTITGQLAVAGAPVRGFYGWLELIDALGRAVGADAHDAGGEQSGGSRCAAW